MIELIFLQIQLLVWVCTLRQCQIVVDLELLNEFHQTSKVSGATRIFMFFLIARSELTVHFTRVRQHDENAYMIEENSSLTMNLRVTITLKPILHVSDIVTPISDATIACSALRSVIIDNVDDGPIEQTIVF